MPYRCQNPEAYLGNSYGSGHCVPFVQMCAGAPQTKLWKQGSRVRSNAHLAKGTAIATFKDGKYQNAITGNHAAIFISQDDTGIWVYDQYLGVAVDKRHIRFNGGVGSMSRDADTFYVIE